MREEKLNFHQSKRALRAQQQKMRETLRNEAFYENLITSEECGLENSAIENGKTVAINSN